MAPRPNWKGYLKLSLVSCPVALYTAASTSERAALHLINRKTGNRLRRQLIDSQTGDVVEDEDQARGYEMSRGEYVLLEDEELDEIALESTHTVDIERFVPRAEVDELYLDTPYYMAPDGEVGEEAFAVIRDAMKAKKVVGLARVVLYRRERIVMIEPRERGIVATTLRFADEVRRTADYLGDIAKTAVPAEMLDLAEHIIETKAGHFDPTGFEDRYEEALVALIKSKQSGKPPSAAPQPQADNVVNLMDALRRSLGEARRGSPPQHRAQRARPKRRSGSAAGGAGRTRTPRRTRSSGARSHARKAG